MGDKPFYCNIVGARITGDLCERRIKQAKEFRDKGEPHASLNKCIICKGLVPEKPAAAVELAEAAPTVAEILCPQCKRPKVYKKLRWNKKHGMHVNCYYTASKKGKAEVAVPKPALGVKATTVEPLEDPERIIQCSAPPSWVRCHGCYAVKNCAVYDAAVSTGLIFESNPVPAVEEAQPSGDKVPDTSEQEHYTACGIEPLDFIVANNMDFLEGNIIKYIARYKRKNGLEDLAKARHYLDRLIEREEVGSK